MNRHLISGGMMPYFAWVIITALWAQNAAGSGDMKGPPGPPGPIGPEGPHGMQGLPGPEGPVGRQGVAGPPGNIGAKGPPGRDGYNGQPGIEGSKGPQGPPGLRGSPGEKGQTGMRGDTGAKGSKGDTGTKGPPGYDGRMGSPGTQGHKGPPGTNGAPGKEGRPGKPGPRGEKGPPGPRGNGGPVGPSGPTGPPGHPGGPPGPPGPPGPRGYPGQSSASKGTDDDPIPITNGEKLDMSNEMKAMIYVGVLGHVLWLLLVLILTVVILLFYQKLKKLQKAVELICQIKMGGSNNLSNRAGIYEQLSSTLSIISGLNPELFKGKAYEKLLESQRGSHSYFEMASNNSTVDLGGSSGPPSISAATSSRVGRSAIPGSAGTFGPVGKAGTSGVQNTYYGGTGGSDAGDSGTGSGPIEDEEVLMQLRSTGIMVRDLRERFESERAQKGADVKKGKVEVNEGITGDNRNSGYEVPISTYMTVIAPPLESEKVSNHSYADRESRTFAKFIPDENDDSNSPM